MYTRNRGAWPGATKFRRQRGFLRRNERERERERKRERRGRGQDEKGAAAHFARTGRGRARPWRAMTRHRRDILDPGARSRRREIRRAGRGGARLLGLSRFSTGITGGEPATATRRGCSRRLNESKETSDSSTRLENERKITFLFSLCSCFWNSRAIIAAFSVRRGIVEAIARTRRGTQKSRDGEKVRDVCRLRFHEGFHVTLGKHLKCQTDETLV